MARELQTAVFGGGCFWCTEAIFERLKGVESVTSGYAGGPSTRGHATGQASLDPSTGSGTKPTYEEVSAGRTGHAEVIKVEYDPKVVTYEDLLNVFFGTHDPTTPNQQGADVGSQYRSLILYTNDQQRRAAEAYVEKLELEGVFDSPIVTEVRALDKFHEAEDYHQDYYAKNPDKSYCQAVINPKLAKLRQKFAKLLRAA